MAQAVRERTSELGVLKTLGFSNGSVLALVLGESLLHRAARRRGSGLGAGLADRAAAATRPAACCRSSCCPAATSSLGAALIVAARAWWPASLPAATAMRLRITDALRRRGLTMFALARPDRRRHAAQPADHSAAARLVGASPSSASPASSSCSSRCCRSPRASPRRCRAPARPTARIVMRSGADSEMTSGLGRRRRRDRSSRRRASAATARRPLASAELFVIIDLPKTVDRHAGQRAAARHRAGDAGGARRRLDRRGPDARVRHQRGHRRARRQRPVRRADARQRRSARARTPGRSSASSRPTAASSETEIWCDARVLQGAYRRGNTLPVGAVPGSTRRTRFDTFKDWLTANPQLNVQVRRETEYYAQQSRGADQR